MYVRRTEEHVEVLAPAKLNLFLEVLAKRPDGFHEIETVMAPVGLFDGLTVKAEADAAIRLTCEQLAVATANSTTENQNVPTGPENLIVRALEALRRQAGIASGATVQLTKRIPLAAGMAGGSTDAAAALAAANKAWDLHWPAARLAEVAATLGSDIPFFFARTAALCRGRGEQVEPLSSLVPLDFVVVAPPAGLSTADVYRNCRPAAEPKQARDLILAWKYGDKVAVGRLLHNRLQEPAERLCEWIARLKNEFNRYDCLGHQMSGSGTSYFALCRDALHARRLAAAVAARGWGRVMTVRSCTA